MEQLKGYNVLREKDRASMLERIGVQSIDELLDFIPPGIRLDRELDLPPAQTEWELSRHMRQLASLNETADTHACFLGGGTYDHHIPEVVNTIANRGEFLTAYTPYQPEISQGLLRVLFDFQKIIGQLFEVPAVNCSVYDGATALAESAWMAISAKGVKRLIVSDAIWPEYLEVLQVYMKNRKVQIDLVSHDPTSGAIDLDGLATQLEQPSAAVIVQYPNCHGVIEPLREIIDRTHNADALAIVGCYPAALGLLEPPGRFGADIVYAEGQSLGLPLAAGGPHAGLIGTQEALIDYLPGRLVGEVTDIKGQSALALIKQEREQHVRRHEATSHICSNQALMALRILVFLSLAGESGLRRMAILCAQKAHSLKQQLAALPDVSLSFSGATFNEFCLDLPVPSAELIAVLRNKGIHAGIDVSPATDASGASHRLLVAVTETKSKAMLDQYIKEFGEALKALS